jgi:hypothetical protein
MAGDAASKMTFQVQGSRFQVKHTQEERRFFMCYWARHQAHERQLRKSGCRFRVADETFFISWRTSLNNGSRRDIGSSYAPTPETIIIAEIFKIKKGRIRGIVANGTRVPYGLGDGWAGPFFK